MSFIVYFDCESFLQNLMHLALRRTCHRTSFDLLSSPVSQHSLHTQVYTNPPSDVTSSLKCDLLISLIGKHNLMSL